MERGKRKLSKSIAIATVVLPYLRRRINILSNILYELDITFEFKMRLFIECVVQMLGMDRTLNLRTFDVY